MSKRVWHRFRFFKVFIHAEVVVLELKNVVLSNASFRFADCVDIQDQIPHIITKGSLCHVLIMINWISA